jgi:hypothetical protein
MRRLGAKRTTGGHLQSVAFDPQPTINAIVACSSRAASEPLTEGAAKRRRGPGFRPGPMWISGPGLMAALMDVQYLYGAADDLDYISRPAT